MIFWYYIHILPVWMYVWETWYYLISRLLCNYLPPSKKSGSYLREILRSSHHHFLIAQTFWQVTKYSLTSFFNNFMWKFPFSWNDDSFIMTHNFIKWVIFIFEKIRETLFPFKLKSENLEFEKYPSKLKTDFFFFIFFFFFFFFQSY